MKEQQNSRRQWWICLALAAITIAVFSPLFHYDFLTFDDQVYVTENPYVRSGLNFNSIAWAFQTSTSCNWLPLAWISHMLDFQCYGMKAGGHHLTNVLIHAVNVVLLFLLLQKMTGAIWRSALVAAFFAWHPAHVESVAWIAERKDVLSSFFALLTLLAYAGYAKEPKRKLLYLSTIVLFALGLMAKPMIVTVPFAMLLLDFWPFCRMSRQSFPQLLIEKIPLFALSAACCVVTVWAQSNAMASTAAIPLGHRLAHALASYLDYIVMLIFPRDLAIFYPYPNHEKLIAVIAGAAMLILVSTLALVWARRRPWLAVGWLWFVGMLVPVIGLVQVGDQALADRYTYLPAVGLFVMAVWSGAELAARYAPVKLIAPAVLAAMLAATWMQIHYWRDTRTVFERAVRVTPNNYLALALLGSLRAEDGDVEGAMRLYHEALAVKPNYSKGHFYLAHGLQLQGKFDEAKAEYKTSLRLDPNDEPAHVFLGLLFAREQQYDQAAAEYEAALKINPHSANAHNDLARILQSQGRLDESARHYLAALQFDPSLAEAHNNLGALYLQQDRLAEGVAQLREALRLNPGNTETEFNLALGLNLQKQWKEAAELWHRLVPARPQDANAQYQFGLALAHLGKTREAMGRYAQAILLTPDFAEALDALAWIIATDPHPELRNGAQAVAMAKKACDLTARQQPAMLLTLAAAYGETGQFSEAQAAAETAQQLATAKGKSELGETAARIKIVLAAKEPYRQPQN